TFGSAARTMPSSLSARTPRTSARALPPVDLDTRMLLRGWSAPTLAGAAATRRLLCPGGGARGIEGSGARPTGNAPARRSAAGDPSAGSARKLFGYFHG